jgi:hypothetical protein
MLSTVSGQVSEGSAKEGKQSEWETHSWNQWISCGCRNSAAAIEWTGASARIVSPVSPAKDIGTDH